jgi:hypothetical protein
MLAQQRKLIIHDGENSYVDDLKRKPPDYLFELCSNNKIVI